jgi:hypothetical protein
MQITNKYMKRCSTSLSIRKMPIQTTLRAGRVAQVVGCLPSKCDALSSNTSTGGKKPRKTCSQTTLRFYFNPVRMFSTRENITPNYGKNSGGENTYSLLVKL